jgi:hypothetical protein
MIANIDGHRFGDGKARTANSTYPKGGVSCSKDSFVVNQTLVFQIKFCGKSPALRVAANRSCHINDTTDNEKNT